MTQPTYEPDGLAPFGQYRKDLADGQPVQEPDEDRPESD